MLTWVAIPKSILSVVLPPLSLKTGNGAFWINFRRRTNSVINDGEAHAVVVHSTSHKVINFRSLICQGTFRGTVLVMELHWGRVIII